ncbi:mRNA capping enzyme-domain-containing protein [Lentinula aff. detonsa]|uniref:mRNA cap guanine-N(7) methyltransferase n=1 Tax=Lentinula aff. detonsa TaxID=2804958 RepID=A0AA38KQ75_9AGAR|nr:mRNA capping enzyme-domain-containing protein [Lentinula aff. detonsa]
MPFDPVRDAVLNSPATEGLPTSPSVARRATHLSVLLNADSEPLPRTSSSLSQIIHLEPTDKLSSVKPLKKAQETTLSPSDSRPSSSSYFQPASTFPPVMRPPPLLYNPTQRVTPPDSILTPMSKAEMEMYKSYVGKGTARLVKRKRPRDDSDTGDEPPVKKSVGNGGVVVEHYNARPEVGVIQRLDSPIIGLKNFNNWVKSVLISKFAHPALVTSSVRTQRNKGKVLDLGCGKGGDITKWSKARISDYVGADIAAVSVEQAKERWEFNRNANRIQASFATYDFCSQNLEDVFAPEILEKPFDVVSSQFCIHYAFEKEETVRRLLRNVSHWLRPGGTFIGTIPNAEQLLEHLRELPPENQDLSFGNAVYKVRFESREHSGMFGRKYWFFLQDAVEDVPEYLVYWDNFVSMAAEYNLQPLYKEEFHNVFSEHQDHPEFGPLMVRMRVMDANGESSMDEDQWEAANIYIAFAFEKR